MKETLRGSAIIGLTVYAFLSFSLQADISEERRGDFIPHFTDAVRAAEERIAIIESVFQQNSEEIKVLSTGLFVNSEGAVITSITSVAGAEQIFVKKLHSQRQPVNIHAINQPLGLALLTTPFEVKMEEKRHEEPAMPGEWLIITYVSLSAAEGNGHELNLFPVILCSKKSSLYLFGKRHAPLLKLSPRSPLGSAASPIFNSRGGLEGIIIATKKCPETATGCTFGMGREKLDGVSKEMEKGVSRRMGWLGAALRTVDLSDYNYGVQVVAVMQDYPAYKAGIKPGDIILSVDGELITEPSVIKRIIAHSAPGREIELTVVQNAETKNLNILLEARPLLISIER